MNINEFLSVFQEHPTLSAFDQYLKESTSSIRVNNLHGSSKPMLCAHVFKNHDRSLLVMLPDKEEASYFYYDLVQLIGEENAYYFPSSYKRSVVYKKSDPANIILRTEVLNNLANNQKMVVVTFPEAAVEKVVLGEDIKSQSQEIKTGDKLDISFLSEVLDDYGFERVDFVYEPGQYALRGGIMDIFSFSGEYPVRVDFFGDEIDSIRTFDTETQLSIQKREKVIILPDLRKLQHKNNSTPLTKIFPQDALLWFNSRELFADKVEEIKEAALISFQQGNEEEEEETHFDAENLCSKADFMETGNFTLVETGSGAGFSYGAEITFKTAPQPRFQKNFEMLFDYLHNSHENGYKTWFLSNSEKQLERLKAIFEDSGSHISYTPVNGILHEGFTDHELQLNVFTDHQVFDRYHRVRLRTDRLNSGNASLSLKEINQLNPGDYVVHTDHGVGKFGGLATTDINGKQQEVIKLIYKDNDVIFVSIHSLHRISKFKGKDGEPPKINKLGSGAWQKMKSSAKGKIKDIARDLIKLYAKRREEKGYAFRPDTYLQTELEASFIYEDTPDQEKATVNVKADMEQDIPMDRLVCGDVGFGKTEVAIRAAFKAVTDSKQVAVLVPTTILAFQHYNTFRSRLKDFPVTIEYVSRFRKPAEIKKVLKSLKEGKVDILIGTHRLISKDVEFKDLGLLVVDEEQKFGVATKEKLKSLKVNVDTLTLTATPIPRTMQFSLLGARDLSVINTPPPNRYPIQTELHALNENIIREAIYYELERNGQAFFIHNRIQNIYEVETMLRRAVPEARIVVGHGQMDGKKLETILLDFMDGQYDVLLATTIIESGLDIPNANTILINNAQNFGLSELHQLRGRVGRSNKKAFCYLLSPPLGTLPADARRRLQAIESFSDLGSGFNIALQDLDIRGAGNLLGGEQSGFIANIGLETYHQILNEAMLELQETEFKDLFKDRRTDTKSTTYITDSIIESDLELLIPTSYVSNITERMNLYRELDNIKDEKELAVFEAQLKDRFGEIPDKTNQLIQVVRLRWEAIKAGIEKIVLKNGIMITYFISDQNSAFYTSEQFTGILEFLKNNPKACKIKDTGDKLSLVFSNVKSIDKSLKVVKSLLE